MMNNINNIEDVDAFLEQIRENIDKYIEIFNNVKQSSKAQMVLKCEYRRQRTNEKEQNCNMTFYTKQLKIYNANDIEECIRNHYYKVMKN